MALRPVCMGSCTLLRFTMPGALISTLRECFESMGPRPSMGLPSPSTTRPSSASPTGTSAMRPVRFTESPSRISSAWPITATPTLSSSRFSTRPRAPVWNSTSSPAATPERP